MTDLFAWLNPTRWLVLLAAAGALTLGYAVWKDHQQDIGEGRANVRWKTATDQLKRDATAALDAETKRVKAAEQALQDFKNERDLKDANNQTTVAGLASRIRVLAGPTGRLRDPNAVSGCGCGGGSAPGQAATATGDRADHGAEAGGLLSKQLTEKKFSKAAYARFTWSASAALLNFFSVKPQMQTK